MISRVVSSCPLWVLGYSMGGGVDLNNSEAGRITWEKEEGVGSRADVNGLGRLRSHWGGIYDFEKGGKEWISYLRLCNKLPQTWQLETRHIYYPIVSLGQESGYGPVFQGLSQDYSGVLGRAGVSLRIEWGRVHFPAPIAVGKIWFFVGYETEGLRLLAGCQLDVSLGSWPHGPLHTVDYFLQRRVNRESASKKEVTVLNNVTTEVTSPLSYSTGWKQVTGPTHVQRDDNFTRVWIPGGRDYWEPF